MKKLHFLFRFFLFSAVLSAVGINFTGCEKEPMEFGSKTEIVKEAKTDSVYLYPIKPGSTVWESYDTQEEKLNACQLPVDFLKNLPINGLIKTVLDYPLLLDLFAYDNLQDGFDVILGNFNGFQELIKREEAPDELLEFYRKLDPNVSLDQNEKGIYSLQIMVVEMFLSQDQILKKLPLIDRNELLKLCVEKHYIMERNPDTFGLFSSVSQSLTIYRIMGLVSPSRLKNADVEFEFFVQKGNIPSDQGIILNSFDIACNYLNSIGYQFNITNLKSAAATCTPASGTVKTPKGSLVTVSVYNCEPLSSTQITSINSYFRSTYPKAIYLSPSSGKFNCHSYAWYQSSSSNYRWMNNPSKYWSDGSYSQVYYCAPSLIWTYGSTSHSAIAFTYGGLPLRSKWGSGPVMQHTYSGDNPYSGTLRTYKKN